MEKRRLLFLSQPNLLSESLEHILGQLEDVQVTGPCPLDDRTLAHCLEQRYDLVLIADDESTQQASVVMSALLEARPQMPIIRVKLAPNVLYVYCSQAVPARVADLIEVIRQVPLSES